MTDVLDEVLAQIAAAPHSASALTFYAFASTLQFEQAGCLFKLAKLRDLSPEQRQVAYRMIELMAEGGNAGAAWIAAKQRMDELIRAG